MRAQLITPPENEPLTIAEIRMHLRNPEITTDDADLLDKIQSARETAENKLGRALITQTWEAYFDYFPGDCYGWGAPLPGYAHYYRRDNFRAHNEIDLPYPPLQSVTSVKYLDSAGALQTMPSTDYVVEAYGLPGRVRLAYGKSWPSTQWVRDAVTIRFVAGWASADDVPASIKSWMKLYITTLYEHRKPEVIGVSATTLPFADGLLDRYRVPVV